VYNIRWRWKLDVEVSKRCDYTPCTWMNAVMKKGAYAQMRGRGGLRVKVVSGGELSCGVSELLSEVEISENPLKALSKISLPSL